MFKSKVVKGRSLGPFAAITRNDIKNEVGVLKGRIQMRKDVKSKDAIGGRRNDPNDFFFFLKLR